MNEAPQRHQAAEQTRGFRKDRPTRTRVGALLASIAVVGLVAVAIASASSPANARHPGAKSTAHADYASYQQFAWCMRAHGFAQWPDANPAHPAVFAVAPQAATGSKQRLGAAARGCTASIGNGDVTLIP